MARRPQGAEQLGNGLGLVKSDADAGNVPRVAGYA
jgi:hypothetical protein